MLDPIATLAALACAAEPLSPMTQDTLAPAGAEIPQASAPGPSDSSQGWSHSIALYFMAAGLDGETTVKGLDADVDVSFSDIADYLEIGGMLAYRAETERYAIGLDAVYMGLGAEKDKGSLSTEVDVDELVIELDGSWRVDPRTDLFVGARYWNLSSDVEITGPGPGLSASGDQEWIDPLVGARHTWPFAQDLSLTLRGDIGGFGVGSDFSWQALARVNWQVSSASSLVLGYRVIDVDYQDGSGTDEFRYDVTTSGLLFGLIYTF